LKRFFIVGRLYFIVEEYGMTGRIRLIVYAIKHPARPNEAITLSGSVPDISLCQMIFKSRQHLVDALTDGIKGELVDDLEV
jgi:hypothetical protein